MARERIRGYYVWIKVSHPCETLQNPQCCTAWILFYLSESLLNCEENHNIWNMNGTIREDENFKLCQRGSASQLSHHTKQMCAGVTKFFFFLPPCLPELILTTWKTSFPFSSWEQSTRWLDLHWQWLASTSWFSSWVECCTASPTCLPCGRRPALWPTPWRRYPVSPWPCRSCWRSQRTPERKYKGTTCGLFLEKRRVKTWTASWEDKNVSDCAI